MSDQIPAATLYEPFASLIACGAKVFETRWWAPHLRHVGNRIAIHAAKRIDVDACKDEDVYPAMYRHGLTLQGLRATQGKVVCTARLSAVLKMHNSILPGEGPENLAFSLVAGTLPEGFRMVDDGLGNYGFNRIAWYLTDIDRLDPPVPARGNRSIWYWTPPTKGERNG